MICLNSGGVLGIVAGLAGSTHVCASASVMPPVKAGMLMRQVCPSLRLGAVVHPLPQIVVVVR